MRFIIFNANFRHVVEGETKEVALEQWAEENPELAQQTILVREDNG